MPFHCFPMLTTYILIFCIDPQGNFVLHITDTKHYSTYIFIRKLPIYQS
ncbi:hypothetical protein RchiOBHm_Chr5g0012621 [Rosa chinensis]|uniref:Uncharacterized protein n=1 Tax=Rosa chinensis TaxID=74649 RepID=A0A2P6Q553_ROSCH|nr:hypothetical protein RchiOBHm_Chr5g0012621 [Rosa chinensis]